MMYYLHCRYVALSDNEKTGYKARELKSVHVDAVGTFVKFVIHKNHINRHNLYNQVHCAWGPFPLGDCDCENDVANNWVLVISMELFTPSHMKHQRKICVFF